MKKRYFSFLFTLFIPMFLHSQTVEVTPFGGYVFPATWYATSGNVYFHGNGQYGGMINIGINPAIDIDLIYNRSDTRAQANVPGYPMNEVPLSINYFQVGGTKNFRVSKMLSPFIGGNVGGCLAAPKGDYNDQWFFSVGIQGGAKIYFSRRIGIRLQAQLYMPVQGAGYMFYFGPGGSGSTVTLTSTLVNFGFTGGLIFRLGKVMP
ncbi:MAG TPA: hypothetical protein PKN12_06930 [Bacteroidales bacterium]|jgi:hypothetical protein|nr:hypothetical protein [Bacteroidales bacterium]HPT09365.1 hypothetical protein [Bacteroidales bacterium]